MHDALISIAPDMQTMKDFISKRENVNRIEFWFVTTLFVFLVFFHISDTLNINRSFGREYTRDLENPFNYYFVAQLIRYVVLYGAFLLMNFVVVPKLIRKESVYLNLFITAIVLLLLGLIFGINNTYLRYEFERNYNYNAYDHSVEFQKSFLYAFWLMLMFTFYNVIKYVGLYLLARSEALHARFKIVTPGGIAVFVVWMISIFLLIIGNADRGVIAAWAIFIPAGIIFYWYSYHTFIPIAHQKRNRIRAYAWRALLVLLISILPISILFLSMVQEAEVAFSLGTFNAALHFFVTAPLSYIIYRRNLRGNEEIVSLKRELGRSNANFDFLRSQINPHFLFNALNTIYGTAIQEKAERTSEGIEKLGEMMRFMLQENMQEKIPLSREIQYLNNYISLQKLRTDPNPNIRIIAQIDEKVNNIQIAPMLLIPFVENSFKHGISFREASDIKITLEIRDKKLLFDVNNSKHEKQGTDPEKNYTGIGLNNVKQRLMLLYPNRHELIIRETAKDFFVHLTISL